MLGFKLKGVVEVERAIIFDWPDGEVEVVVVIPVVVESVCIGDNVEIRFDIVVCIFVEVVVFVFVIVGVVIGIEAEFSAGVTKMIGSGFVIFEEGVEMIGAGIGNVVALMVEFSADSTVRYLETNGLLTSTAAPVFSDSTGPSCCIGIEGCCCVDLFLLT